MTHYHGSPKHRTLSEPSITLQKGQVSLCFTPWSYLFGLHNPETIWVAWILKSELYQLVLVGGLQRSTVCLGVMLTILTNLLGAKLDLVLLQGGRFHGGFFFLSTFLLLLALRRLEIVLGSYVISLKSFNIIVIIHILIK